MGKPTYGELIIGEHAYANQIAEAYRRRHGQDPAATDIAHNIWRLLEEGWTIEALVRDILGDQAPQPTEPQPEQPTDPTRFPVPPAAVDLTSWPRRGAYIAGALVDPVWDVEQLAARVGSIFGGRASIVLNVLSAPWPESASTMLLPFQQLPDGRWNLELDNPAFYDRLRRAVEVGNRYGVVPLLCFLELYSWSYRKSVPFDQALAWPTNNVNGIRWRSRNRAEDDATFRAQPGPWLLGLVEKVCRSLAGLRFGVIPGNEYPEKRVHVEIAQRVKAVDASIPVIVNRNDQTPGQYRNMKVGEGTVDRIAFHGWKNLGFLDVDFPDHYKNAEGVIIKPTLPRTFRQFFDNKAWDGRRLDHDFRRVIIDSDGARSSDDPVHTYNEPELLKVFEFGARKGCSLLHQSRSKMPANRGRLETLETDFLKQIAEL